MGVRRLLLVLGLLCVGFAAVRFGYSVYLDYEGQSDAARQAQIDEAVAAARGTMTLHPDNQPNEAITLTVGGLGIVCILMSFVPGLRVPSAGE